MIKEAATKIPNFCIHKKNNKLQLKRNHEIFYQIQGQLNIFEKKWCDFVLRRTNPYDLFIERIYRDQNIWVNEMLPKLEQFYRKFLLPELALPRYGTYSGIRKPVAPWFDLSDKHCSIAVQKPVTISKTRSSKVTTSKSCPTADPKPGPSKQKDKQTELDPKPGPSKQKDKQTEENVPSRRSSRIKTVKFVGRHILHKWILDEAKDETKWYSGIVLDVIKGVDGDPNAEYRVKYKGEDTAYDVEDLYSDYLKGWIKFLDI